MENNLQQPTTTDTLALFKYWAWFRCPGGRSHCEFLAYDQYALRGIKNIFASDPDFLGITPAGVELEPSR